MPVTVMSLHSARRDPADLVGELAAHLPAGSTATLHELATHYLRISIDENGSVDLRRQADLIDGPPEPLMLNVAIDADDPTPERTAAGLLDAIEDLTVSSAALESRFHLDVVPAGSTPGAHAFIMNHRQPRMTRDEFYWYYRTNHTALANNLQPAFLRYATHRVLHSRGPHFADGVTVQEYPDTASFQRHLRTRTRPDDVAFLDIANFVGMVDYWIGERRWDIPA